MTFDELKSAGYLPARRCSICGVMLGYQVHLDMAAAVFQSGCDCGDTYPNWRVITHQELADLTAPEKANGDQS